MGRGLSLLAMTALSLGVCGCGAVGDSSVLEDPITASTIVGQWSLVMTVYSSPGNTVYSTTLSIDEAAVIIGICSDGSGQFNGTRRANNGILWSGQVACALIPGQEYPRVLFYNGNLSPDSNESMSGQGSAATQETPGGPTSPMALDLTATRQQ